MEAPKWVRRGGEPKLEDVPSHYELDASKPSVFSSNLKTGLLIGTWYASNIGVLLLNKYLLSYFGFRYPVFLTMLHMCACAAYSYLAIARLRIVPIQVTGSRKQFFKIVGLSCLFSFSVVTGNMSLRLLPVSFNQAIGATTPFFTAIFAMIITCKRESVVVYLALVPVVVGIVIASNGEPLFHLLGFVACIASTGARALKSVVQELLLTSDSEKLHSMNLLMYMAPMAAIFLLPAAWIIEGNIIFVIIDKTRESPLVLLLLFLDMTIAYLVNLLNFMVTKHTSALTLQVLGNAKSVVAAAISVLIFQNPVTIVGMTGFAITIIGVALYSEAKKWAKNNSQATK
ncbi:hypothetical protein O6H91_15G061600 [Diphasiastrum complanatum]|uniref:Uncharacterized protein n=1 Tax=Diphasiastrum complanatum TaxID=34168 RepID=A0ACC2BIT7_DIPCM|nr:hypothetical protein O6H91_15G061600 [Diphasiastrum complanatum]